MLVGLDLGLHEDDVEVEYVGVHPGNGVVVVLFNVVPQIALVAELLLEVIETGEVDLVQVDELLILHQLLDLVLEEVKLLLALQQMQLHLRVHDHGVRHAVVLGLAEQRALFGVLDRHGDALLHVLDLVDEHRLVLIALLLGEHPCLRVVQLKHRQLVLDDVQLALFYCAVHLRVRIPDESQ